MHEVTADGQDKTQEKILSQLEILVEVQMMTMIQLSKVYDIMVATAVGANNDQLEQILDNHEKGLMASSEPVLRGFAAAEGEALEPSAEDLTE